MYRAYLPKLEPKPLDGNQELEPGKEENPIIKKYFTTTYEKFKKLGDYLSHFRDFNY